MGIVLTAAQNRQALECLAMANTVYNVRWGLVQPRHALSFQNDVVNMQSIPNARPLLIDTPPGYTIVQVVNDPKTGTQAMVAYNPATNTIKFSPAGMDGAFSDPQDTASGMINLGTNQFGVLQGPRLDRATGQPVDPDAPSSVFSTIVRVVDQADNTLSDLKIDISAQSMGAAIGHYSAADIILNAENPLHGRVDPRNITLDTFNGEGSNFGFKLLGYSDAQIAAYANSGIVIRNWVVTNGEPVSSDGQ